MISLLCPRPCRSHVGQHEKKYHYQGTRLLQQQPFSSECVESGSGPPGLLFCEHLLRPSPGAAQCESWRWCAVILPLMPEPAQHLLILLPSTLTSTHSGSNHHSLITYIWWNITGDLFYTFPTHNWVQNSGKYLLCCSCWFVWVCTTGVSSQSCGSNAMCGRGLTVFEKNKLVAHSGTTVSTLTWR